MARWSPVTTRPAPYDGLVELSSTVATSVAIAAAAIVLVALLATLLWRRAVVRRLISVAARLDGEAAALVRGRGTERVLQRLERCAEHAAEQVDAAGVSRARLWQTLCSVHQGVVICDEHGEVVFRNERAEAYLGARHGEALAEHAIDELLAAALAGRIDGRTVELFGPPRRTLIITGTPLDDGRRSIGAAVVIEDISERRRLDAMRRDFVANISHELKTPVGALGLLAETLAAEDDVDVARRLAVRMENEAQRVGRIIDDLLDLSRIEAEEAPQREPVPVHLVIAQAVDRVRPGAEARAITIDALEPPRRLTVVGDRRQLVSALYNLLENAVKYSSEGSSVVVRALTNGVRVDLVVSDSGIGIPARDLERIFERFYRVDRGRGRDTGGTGLGLAIVRHVATNHGGEVIVESREGDGSTFRLRLPAAPGQVTAAS
jgi:two-component system, OmpR family, sensor histidine kinase SenX3